jgi:hypothetical protein
MQAMQMASNLRQAVDEAPMESYYCQTENMGIYDKSNRLDFRFVKRMNAKLADLGMPQWEEVAASEDVKQLSQWLDDSWRSEFPMLQDLLSLGKLTICNLKTKNLMEAIRPTGFLQQVDMNSSGRR